MKNNYYIMYSTYLKIDSKLKCIRNIRLILNNEKICKFLPKLVFLRATGLKY
jgi:hypothetical protein